MVGVWSSTNRATRSRWCGAIGRNLARAREVQVSRLGNPLVNEVVIPLGKKDFFNRDPAVQGRRRTSASTCVTPELAKVINILFPGLNVPETNRTDIVQALLTGIPGLTQIAPNAPPTDTLKINLGVPPTRRPEPLRRASAATTPGFPNGPPARPTT